MDGYDAPFDGMSEDEFMYRAMNEDDPMYMGGDTYVDGSYVDTESDDDRVADWHDTQFGKILDAVSDYMDDPADNPRHHFDGIDYDPFPER